MKPSVNISAQMTTTGLLGLAAQPTILLWVDERIEYGEARMIALAPTTGILYYMAFVDRGRARRIISLRRDYRREVKHYVQSS